MSIQLYNSDNMSVIGEIKKDYVIQITGENCSSCNGETKEKILYLFFSVHINGKLKTFNVSFCLIPDTLKLGEEILVNEKSSKYRLKNYQEWSTFTKTLSGLGYDTTKFFIGEWIDTLTLENNI